MINMIDMMRKRILSIMLIMLCCKQIPVVMPSEARHLLC